MAKQCAEPLEAQLGRLYDQIETKRVKIASFDGYGKDTFLAFDSFNLGLTTALEMVGAFMTQLENQKRMAAAEAKEKALEVHQ